MVLRRVAFSMPSNWLSVKVITPFVLFSCTNSQCFACCAVEDDKVGNTRTDRYLVPLTSLLIGLCSVRFLLYYAMLSTVHLNPQEKIAMNVALVSQDADLFELCREIFNEYQSLGCHLSRVVPGTSPTEADLYIWDSTTPLDFPREIERHFSKHLFLVHRSEVAELHENLGTAKAAILLKPVTRACLSSFLGLAASTFQEDVSTAHFLRTDRDEILQCLIQSNLQLQQYDQDRTTFLTRAVHDFRAPLTATGGYCGLLLGGALGPLAEEQKEVLRRMQHSIKRLSRMASAMFELGVGRHITRQPDLRPGDMRGCVEQALHEITPFADGKNISLSVDLVPESGMVYVEPGQIEQVLMNLLDNACKFTPKGGDIEVLGYPIFWDRRMAPLLRWPSAGIASAGRPIRTGSTFETPVHRSRSSISEGFSRNTRLTLGERTDPAGGSAWQFAK